MLLNNKYENFYKAIGEEVHLEAVIISGPKESEYYNSYTVKGKTEKFKNKKFILYVKKNVVFEYGDRVKLVGKFSKPEDSRNYKGFSYKNYLHTEKIYGSIKSDTIKIKSKNNTTFIFKLSNSIRNKIIEQINKILPKETGGLLIGLMLGDKNYISDELKLYFQKSSLAHILAVSGSHVSYIILGLTYIASINKMPKKSGYIFIIFILIVFIFITNFSVSVIRACIMSIVLILSKIFYRKSDIPNTIAISILIIVIFNPYSINSVSMQLSYLGTIGVIYVTSVIEKILKNILNPTRFGGLQKLIKVVSVPIASQITIIPIMIKNFNTIYFTFLISNLIAMPLLGISIIGGYLLIIFSFLWIWGANQIGFFFNLILNFLIFIAKFCGNLKLSNIYVITPSTFTIIIYYIIVILVVYWFQYKEMIITRRVCTFLRKHAEKKCLTSTRLGRNIIKLLIIILLLVLIIEIPYQNYNGKLKIYFIDVGQRR